MRLNMPSAAFANSSSSVDPYARIATSAVCSISSYRTGRPNAHEDESPPVSRVRSKRGRRLDSALAAGPDQLVHLELESNGQALLEDPRCEPSRIQPVRDLVRRRRGGEEDRASPCADLRQDAPREFVIRAIEEDELHLVVLPEAFEVRVRLVRDHPGAWALHVHHVPHVAGRPLVRDERVERREVDLAVRLDRMDEGPGKAFDCAGDRLALEQRFAAGPAQVPNPPGVGLKVAREAENLLDRRVDANPGEVAALDRVHRVAPPTAQVARVQAHEDCREADERALPLDRHIAFAEEELLPLAGGGGGRGLHRGSNEPRVLLSVRRVPPARGVRQWILHTGFAKSFEPELTRIADSARPRPAEVARPRELPGNPELFALPDDVRLGHVDQGSADLDDVAFDAPLRPEAGDLAEGRVVLRTAVRISRIVELIGRDHDRPRGGWLPPAPGGGPPDRFSRGDGRGWGGAGPFPPSAVLPGPGLP